MRSAKSMNRMSKQSAGGKKSKSKSKSKGKKSKSGKKSRSGSKNKIPKGKMASGQCMCMKCRVPVTPEGGSKKTYPNGRCAMTGKCPSCGTNVFKFCKC